SADRAARAAPARGKAQPVRVHDELVAVLVMLAVAHELADVVQQARGFQQEPLLRLAAGVAAELVEELERQVTHVLDVAAVALAALGELPEQSQRIRRGGLLR